MLKCLKIFISYLDQVVRMRDWKPRDLAQSFQLMLLDGSTVRLHDKARSFKEDRITLWSLKSGAMEVRSSDQASFERRVAPDCWLTKPGSTLKVSSLSTYHSIGLVLVGDAPMSLEERLKKDMPQALSQQIESWSLRWWRSPSEYLKVNAEFNLWYCQGLEDEAWGPGDDPFMDALRASIRALLTHGPTAQGVAQTMGMSRAQLYRQLSLKKARFLKSSMKKKCWNRSVCSRSLKLGLEEWRGCVAFLPVRSFRDGSKYDVA